jgi:hypothetical protein
LNIISSIKKETVSMIKTKTAIRESSGFFMIYGEILN